MTKTKMKRKNLQKSLDFNTVQVDKATKGATRNLLWIDDL